MRLRKLRMDEVKFSVLVHPELAAGNEWAWCMVEVKAEWRGFVASDYLGCCLYKDEAEFKAPGGYYADMRNQALEYLNLILGEYAVRLRELEIK